MWTPRNRTFILFSIAIVISTIFLSYFLYNDIINLILADSFPNVTREDLQISQNSFINSDEKLSEGSVAIKDEQELKEFLLGEEPNGYLVSNVLLDWEEVGASVDFAENRTLDGRGHTVVLSDKEATADVIDDSYDAINVNWQGFANYSKYGLFVRINEGLIKNIVFAYDSEVCAVNNGEVEINYVGIVCGENKGIIEKCELNVSNKFAYFYISGEEEDSDNFQTHFGGFAGINSGRISKVSVNYDDFFLRIRTKARSDNMFGSSEILAKTYAGGVVGSLSDGAECSNIVISGRDTTFALTADNVGNDLEFKYSGAVAAENSLGGRIDNVIVDFAPEYTGEDVEISKNAVVHCGQATNVTALNGHNCQTDLLCANCDCPEHIRNHCNVIQSDELVKVSVYINEKNNQVVEITPINSLLKSFSFNKYRVENLNNGCVEIIKDDTQYPNAPENINCENCRDGWEYEIIYEIEPYQNSGECFWEIQTTTWESAEFEFTDNTHRNYTGENVLDDFIKLRLDDGRYIKCDLTKMNLTNKGERIYDATFIGEYCLSLLPLEINGRKYLYYDEENRICIPVSNDYTPEIHKYTIDYGKIVPLENTENWTNKDFVFSLENGIEGSADGLVYSVDGSSYSINSLVFHSKNDYLDSVFTVYLTKNGVRVTDDYVFTPKIDITAPKIVNIEFLNPIDGNYYTRNYALFTITDNASGIKSVRVNGIEMTETNGKYFIDLSQTGLYVVEAEDFTGNITIYDFNAYIDSEMPTLRVIATNEDGEYPCGYLSPSDVWFEAEATFGESGGIIEYRIQGEDWMIYNDVVTISLDVAVEFRAVSNTSDGNGYLTSDIITYHVLILGIEKKLVLTGDWFEVIGSKVYDGTDDIGTVEIQFDNENPDVIANIFLLKYLEFDAHFADVNAGDKKEIIIDVWAMENTNIRVINQINDVFGIIERKEVSVKLNYAESTYGDKSPVFNYDVEGVIDEIRLDFAYNATPNSIPFENEYRFWLEKKEFGNYFVGNFDELNSFEKGAELIIHKAVISQLANSKDDFISLDTNNVTNLQIKFRDVVDNDILHLLETSYLNCDSGASLPTDSPSVAGEYKIRLFIPESLQSRYVLDESLFEIKVSIKEAASDNKPGDDTENNDSSSSDTTDTNDGSDEENNSGDKDVNKDGSFIEEGGNNESKMNNYNKILIAAGVAPVSLIAIGIFKRAALKKKIKKSKK